MPPYERPPLSKDAILLASEPKFVAESDRFASLGIDLRLAASGIGPGNTIARDIRLAEMLIAAGRHPDVAALAAPEVKLKQPFAA